MDPICLSKRLEEEPEIQHGYEGFPGRIIEFPGYPPQRQFDPYPLCLLIIPPSHFAFKTPSHGG
jgi:hypothetical protein